MRKGINQFTFPDTMPLRDCLRLARELGYQSFEPCLTAGEEGGGPGWDVASSLGLDNYRNPAFNLSSSDADVLTVKAWADEEGLRLCSVCSLLPFISYPLTSPDPKVRRRAEEVIGRMVEVAGLLGADTVLIIPGGVTPEVAYEDAYRWAQESLVRLAETAGPLGVSLAVENVWNRFLYSPLELCRFLDEIGSPWVGAYLDVANVLNLGFPEQWTALLGSRVKKVHLKDFRLSVGNITGFTNLLDGDVNWPAVVSALKASGYDGDLVVELTPPPRYHLEQALRHANQAVDLIWADEEEKKP